MVSRSVPYPGNTNTTGKLSVEPINSGTTKTAPRALFGRATCGGPTPSNPTTFWRTAVNHNGASPFNGDSTYQVWRDVKVYGAVGDGVTDDSAAFKFAISGR